MHFYDVDTYYKIAISDTKSTNLNSIKLGIRLKSYPNRRKWRWFE